MTLLDAYAVVAFLVGWPARTPVRVIPREGDVAVATANLAEALDVSRRLYGLPIPGALEVLDPLLEEALKTVPLDLAIARRAAELRASYYDPSTRPISLADTALVASARLSDTVATADPAVLDVARAEGLATVVTPGPG